MQECPTIETLLAYVEHELTGEEIPAIEGHLVECTLCRQTVIFTSRNRDLIESGNDEPSGKDSKQEPSA